MGDGEGTYVVGARIAFGPDGKPRVLVQYPDGYLLMSGPNARQLAALLLNVADEWDEVAHVD